MIKKGLFFLSGVNSIFKTAMWRRIPISRCKWKKKKNNNNNNNSNNNLEAIFYAVLEPSLKAKRIWTLNFIW